MREGHEGMAFPGDAVLLCCQQQVGMGAALKIRGTSANSSSSNNERESVTPKIIHIQCCCFVLFFWKGERVYERISKLQMSQV